MPYFIENDEESVLSLVNVEHVKCAESGENRGLSDNV